MQEMYEFCFYSTKALRKSCSLILIRISLSFLKHPMEIITQGILTDVFTSKREFVTFKNEQ